VSRKFEPDMFLFYASVTASYLSAMTSKPVVFLTRTSPRVLKQSCFASPFSGEAMRSVVGSNSPQIMTPKHLAYRRLSSSPLRVLTYFRLFCFIGTK
jgi:hypothetical protein